VDSRHAESSPEDTAHIDHHDHGGQFTENYSGSLSDVRPALRRRPVATTLILLGAVTATALIILALVFGAYGGRWFIVMTPSMGTAAPVGTFVLTTPAHVSELHVGEIIAFHPPPSPAETYTHRVVAIGPTGLITTRGDINGAPDPWRITEAGVVGKATAIIPGLGWLIRGLPIALLGIIVVWLATARVRTAPRKAAYRILGLSLAVSVTAFILRPFTGAVVVQTAITHGRPTATVVSTGLLPIRVHALNGTSTDLRTGQVGQVSVAESAHHAIDLIMTTALHLTALEWLLLIGICCLPLLWTLIVGLPPKEDTP
jgi:signal peptidase I